MSATADMNIGTTWTREKEEELVLLWSEKPCLFNTTLSIYRDRIFRDVAMRELGEKLNMTVEQINTRMRSLRTQYGKLLKTGASGSAAKKHTEKNQWILDKLQFLRNFITNCKDTKSSFQLPDDDEDKEGPSDEENNDEDDDDDSSISTDLSSPPSRPPKVKAKPTIIEMVDDDIPDATPRSTKRPLTSARVPARVLKKKKEEQESLVLDGLARFIDRESKNVEPQPQPDKTDNDLFSEYVGKSLSKFDNKTQSIVKNKIQNIIFQAEMGNLTPPPLAHVSQNQHSFYSQEPWQPNHSSAPKDRQPLFSALHDSMQMYNN